MKELYVTPAIKKTVQMEFEESILLGSVIETRTEVETAGHEVVEHDFSETGFNTEWK